MKWVVMAAALVLAGCGSAGTIKPEQGHAMPVAPYGARATPTVDQLLTASPQARPERSDELLKQSEDRRGDNFQLPPE